MNTPGMRNALSTGILGLLLFAGPALYADKSKPASKPASAPKPAKSSSSGSKPSGGAAAGHSGASTSASHGATTTSHGPTTAGHSGATTTTSPHTTTSATHSSATTTAGKTGTTSTAGKTGTTSTAGKTGTTSTAGRTGTTSTAGKTGTTSTAGKTGTTSTAGKGTTSSTSGKSGPTGNTKTTTTPAAKNSGYAGGKTPNGAKVVHTKSGGTVTKRADGKVATVHDTKRGMEVHHSLNGNRRVVVERRDHSRVVAERGRRGYVQHPYAYRGHEYARRSYYYHGAYYHNYYGRYNYRGVYVEPYYPAYYYAPAYYGWVYNPWVTPVPYAWGWGGNPWYGYYGAAYFTPYPAYASASLWLTDYIVANSLQAAYQAQVDAHVQAAAMSDAAPVTEDVKGLIADEVKRQIALENTEAKGGGNSEPDPASSSIQRALTDGVQHVFVVGQDLDLVDAGGNECAVSEGDALQLTTDNAADATSINLVVLSNKGGKECGKGDTVAVSLQDLQDMQNHMRETVDQGMQELQKKQGKGGLPPAPASAKTPPVQAAVAANAPAPPPEKEVAADIDQESKEADNVEKEAASTETTDAPATDTDAAAPPAEAPTVALGQSFDEVTAALGNPKSIVDLGAKKIYIYKDMKVVFNGGKVTDIQ